MGRVEYTVQVPCCGAPYDVLVGEDILEHAASCDTVRNADRRGIIISKKVLSLHGDRIRSVFSPGVYDYLVMKDGEKQKCFSHVEPFLEKLLKKGFTRHSVLLAIGGGVVGDFAGFTASVYMRGLKIIQIPTTLLSMVDSSIGGKTAVNIGEGKNIAGAFFPPSLVIADTRFLSTLPDGQWREGLSESIKHALIGECKLYEMLRQNTFESLKSETLRAEFVALSAGFKIGVVSRDEKELGERAILNFGHTVAHAIESSLRYKISHGNAVGIGMKIIADVCAMTGRMTDEECRAVSEMIDAYGIAPDIKLPAADVLLEHMKYDKKNSAGSIRFVLLEGLFRPIYNVSVDAEIIRRAIRKYQGLV